MTRTMTFVLAAALAATSACSDGGTPDDTTPDAGGGEPDGGTTAFTCAGRTTTLAFSPGEEQALQDAVNTLGECTTVQLAAGTFTFENAITIRTKGVTLAGAGKGAQGEGTGTATSTVLVFTGAAANTNGVDVVGDRFEIRDLAIWNAKKDGLRIESSTDVAIRNVRTEWATANASTNGQYGIYPVKCTNVLVEGTEAYNAADAGIYVGQTVNAVVRNNIAKQNVAGIEIENTRFADVFANVAQDNTTGLVVFDLPGNPIKGTDVRIHDNTITGNNRPNFASVSASSSTVSQVPAGTGTFVLASRRVDIFGNTFGDNDSVDVAVLSGLAIEPDPALWVAGGFNFATSDVFVHGNTFTGGSGDRVDAGNVDPTLRPLGAALAGLYAVGAALGQGGSVDALVWDGIDAQPTEDNLVNDINLCFSGNTLPAGTTTATADLNFTATIPLLLQEAPDALGAYAKIARRAQGEAPFDCAGIAPAVVPVVLP